MDLWIKRDDLTGFAGGGNKGRKLEYLLPAIVNSGCDAVVTSGALQSNFVRQLAGACALIGVELHAAVMDLPYPDGQQRPEGGLSEQGGNQLLSNLFGAHLDKFPDGTWSELENETARLAQRLEQEGKKVFTIGLGGTSAEGVFAFVEAAKELDQPFDQVIVASSSGSTQVGLAMAFHGTSTKVIGIASDPEPDMIHDLADLSALAASAGVGVALAPEEIDFRTGWVGKGYGVPSEKGEAAREWLARTEGIVLDPIYSGKAFSAVLDLAQQGKLKGKTLFWHTGGFPNACTDYLR